MTRHGIFLFENPPGEQALQDCLDALDACDYPWERCLPELRAESDGIVRVTWVTDGPQGANGWYNSNGHTTNRITLSSRHGGAEYGFVFLHEAGHMVDDCVLSFDQKRSLQAKWHTDDDGFYNGRTDPNDRTDPPQSHEWSHEREHVEAWSAMYEAYVHRHAEAFADTFVQVFAPGVWTDHYPRFSHWSTDVAGLRQIILERTMPYSDVDPDSTHGEAIARAHDLGLLTGFPDGTFRPSIPLTREAAAAVMVRLYDKLNTDRT
jgi:hypothetical protein